MIQFKKLNDAAKIPQRQTPGAGGFDLHTIKDVLVPPERWDILWTGIACAIPEGHVGLIRPRSSLAVRYGVDVLAGVIDSDYRGEIKVLFMNLGYEGVKLEAGDRIAQLLVVPVITESMEVKDLPLTFRGGGGFGSTGK